MGNQIKTEQVKLLKARIVKFSKDIRISTPILEGTLSIKNIRFYDFWYKELDIEFEGKLFVTYNRKRDWYDSKLLNQPSVSKIKVNKIIKKYLESELNRRLKYFGKELNHWDKIKKLNWI